MKHRHSHITSQPTASIQAVVMSYYTAALFFLINLIITMKNVSSLCDVDANSTLKLVHVIFRHGDRTTDATTLYPKDPYINETYYPYGLGELTNKGKRNQYYLGKSLRKRYDQFLGEIYTPDLLEAWSSNINRTKASLQLVLAGLFPPVKEQIWEIGLNWQPIPFNTLPINQDLFFLGIDHPKFKNELAKITNSPKIVKDFERNSEIFNYLSEHSGKEIKTYWDVFALYNCLLTEKEHGLTLPEWTKKVYPYFLKNLTLKSYEINTSTSKLRKFASGYLLKKIVDDSLSTNRKLFLYSGHEFTIAHMLHTLDIPQPDSPPYGSYILFELHNIENVDGFKIFYQDYNSSEPRLLKLPACAEFCPLNQFISLMEEYFSD